MPVCGSTGDALVFIEKASTRYVVTTDIAVNEDSFLQIDFAASCSVTDSCYGKCPMPRPRYRSLGVHGCLCSGTVWNLCHRAWEDGLVKFLLGKLGNLSSASYHPHRGPSMAVYSYSSTL
jgi:hypothetical protein